MLAVMASTQNFLGTGHGWPVRNGAPRKSEDFLGCQLRRKINIPYPIRTYTIYPTVIILHNYENTQRFNFKYNLILLSYANMEMFTPKC